MTASERLTETEALAAWFAHVDNCKTGCDQDETGLWAVFCPTGVRCLGQLLEAEDDPPANN